ncbi:MAG: hypothetical protein ABIN89_25680 [Chitinophagaceae bacterium]
MKILTNKFNTIKIKGTNIFALLFSFLLVCITVCAFAQQSQLYPLTTSTKVGSAGTADVKQFISSVAVTVTVSGKYADGFQVYGTIECLSPKQFTITTSSEYRVMNDNVTIPAGSVMLTQSQKLNAFGNFIPANLALKNIDFGSITDSKNNIILPDGVYRICHFAKFNTQFISNPSAVAECGIFTITCQPINGARITTIVKPVVSPDISQTIANSGITSTMQFSNPIGCVSQVRLYGKIERISPLPQITITTSSDNRLNVPFTPGNSTPITATMQLQAFGNFVDGNYLVGGVNPATLKDVRNNLRLPDGNYRICYYTRYFSPTGAIGGNASNPDLGCGNFTICNGAGVAPQFTQPVNNLTATSLLGLVKPASPVIFTWTPPQSSCGIAAGALTYDFEIREILNNQSITDALNNPYVFRKTVLPSTTFLLDTNLNRNVLQVGKKYAIRVRALSANPGKLLEIDNNGYSRVEGFQYGNSADPQVPKFNVSYIPFLERRSDFWDNKLTDFENKKGGDTLVPMNQYVPLVLTKNNIVYSPDAIELFLVLNPELTEMDKVKLSYAPKLPDLAAVPIKDARNFITEHAMNLTPDVVEENRFKKYLDSLNLYVRTQKTTVQGSELVELVKHLNTFSRQVRITDRVTMNLINTLLSELLFELKANLALLNRRDFNLLKSVMANIEELLTSTSEVTSFLNKYEDQILSYNKIKHPVGYSNTEAENPEYLPALMDPLLPFNVILCRYTKTQPSTPILTTPDLMGTYKVFYVLSTLYNHKNPEINAKSTNTPASTAQVSLPKTTFKLWAENILNRTKTKEQDIDFMDAFLRSKKRWPYPKHFTIIIKAE